MHQFIYWFGTIYIGIFESQSRKAELCLAFKLGHFLILDYFRHLLFIGQVVVSPFALLFDLSVEQVQGVNIVSDAEDKINLHSAQSLYLGRLDIVSRGLLIIAVK